MPASIGELLRIVIVVAVVALLARAARAGWSNRALALRIWRAIRPRHVIGSLGLMVLVLGTAITLLVLVPVSGFGVGALVGLEGNAIFAPIDSALEAPLVQAQSPDQPDGGDAGAPWGGIALVTGFIGLLVLLFPHLAYAEEVAFRVGWEDHDPLRQVLSALRFGLVHMIMLIPLAAALAVGVAGFVYGRIYRRAYRRAAVPRTVLPDWSPRVAEDADGYTRLVLGPPSPVAVVDRTAARRQAAFEAAVWHATFNSMVAGLVWLGYVLSVAIS
ncbi:MAG TPA: hypothetical protein VMM13_20195 [Euzebya sp.]|nr:hypothetical protein [Euzebya sp.]